jgi:CBS domain-containing protein
MNVAGILKAKGNAVYTIEAGSMLADTAKVLSERRIGAVVVIDPKGKIRGILSEREIVSAIAANGPGALMRPVADFMATNIFTCTAADTVEHLMELMTHQRIRHVPVVEQGRLAGIVSIGDVVKRRIAQTVFEAESMRAYIAAG